MNPAHLPTFIPPRISVSLLVSPADHLPPGHGYRYGAGVCGTYVPQADLSLEVSASLVALAMQSKPDRKGSVNSRIPKTLNTKNTEIRELTELFRSGSLVVDRATREAETDPHGTQPRCYRTSPDQPFPLGARPAGGLQFAVNC